MSELSLRNIFIVARREYLERVRTRSFLASTFATPVLLSILLLLPALITSSAKRNLASQESAPIRLVFASDNPAVAELARSQLIREGGAHYDISIDASLTPEERDDLASRLDSARIDGYVWLKDGAGANPQVVFTTHRAGDAVLHQKLGSALTYAYSAERMLKHGLSVNDTATMLQRVDLRVVKGGHSSAYNELRGMMAVMLLVFVMFFSLLSYGVVVMRSVLEEKASRITEVLLCSTTAGELMAGKIIGTGGVGMTQVAVWLSIAAAGASRSPYLRAAIGELQMRGPLMIYFVIFYILGFLLYASIFAGVGAAFNSVDEAQQWNFVILLPLIAASALILPIATSPDSIMSVAVSIFPFCAPVLMFERIAVHNPPAWQIALSLVLMLATIAASFYVCGRIYRIGILMYGKRPSLRELARWYRHA
ncbi:MAG: ABC transporter permease [Candidatus Binatus sp.]|uniref:ABC transporter permease n=1 Tax=Candidatus Binatus sp. TaxID=2811406 RepID=UPI00271C616F|nr:ABC transporter permease [Candidatus Binatus sp.]MDO8431224.1 ABC transporter permease [Candidatus Binatus sp.]